jgi:hypothetical protein
VGIRRSGSGLSVFFDVVRITSGIRRVYRLTRQINASEANSVNGLIELASEQRRLWAAHADFDPVIFSVGNLKLLNRDDFDSLKQSLPELFPEPIPDFPVYSYSPRNRG